MQTNNKLRRLKAVFVLFAVAAMLTAPAVAKPGAKPSVVIIKAEWCSACQKVEPIMMELAKQYGDALNFVVLDVSSEEKVAESAAAARRLGISSFFQENREKTSTVAVFGKANRVLFQTVGNFDREAYARAFDDAIAKAGK